MAMTFFSSLQSARFRFQSVAISLVFVTGCAMGEPQVSTDARRDDAVMQDMAITEAAADAAGDDAAMDTLVPDVQLSDIATIDTSAVDAGPVDVVRPDVCVPMSEVCNGRDDDCNGQTDETGCPGHLLLTEVVLEPNEAEFIEIHNPTTSAVDLQNIYITDFHDYARVVDSMTPSTTPDSDFVAKFPAGASIPAGGYFTISTGSPSTWSGFYGAACPTFYLQSGATLGSCTQSRPMVAVAGVSPSTIGITATLTNAGEPITLFAWDGRTDLMADLDYVYPGAPQGPVGMTVNVQVDKSMQFVDGPDNDRTVTGYRLDTPRAQQQTAPLPPRSASAIRCDNREGTDILTGGNGLFGHNETSENLSLTWKNTTPTLVGDAGSITSVNASPGSQNVGCQ